MFKNKKSLVLLLLALSMVFTACSKNNSLLIATVNGVGIERETFNKEFELVKKIRKNQYGDDILEKDIDGRPYVDLLEEELFRLYVFEEIIAQDLERLEIAVTDKEVQNEMNIMRENDIARLGSEEEYQKFLKDNGFTEEYLKDVTRRQLRLSKHRDDFMNKIHLKDDEIKKYYDDQKENLVKLRISHILLEDENKAKEVKSKLKADASNFAELAAKESVDVQTAEKGGDIGYIVKGNLTQIGLEALEEPIFKLGEGEVSQPIKTDFGYHIVYVEEKLDTQDKLKSDIVARLKSEKHEKKIKELEENAEVKILDKKYKYK